MVVEDKLFNNNDSTLRYLNDAIFGAKPYINYQNTIAYKHKQYYKGKCTCAENFVCNYPVFLSHCIYFDNFYVLLTKFHSLSKAIASPPPPLASTPTSSSSAMAILEALAPNTPMAFSGSSIDT